MFAVAEVAIRARRAAGLPQAQLAERMGAAQPFIARIGSGKTLPSIKTMLRIASAAGTRFVPTFTPAHAQARQRRRPDGRMEAP